MDSFTLRGFASIQPSCRFDYNRDLWISSLAITNEIYFGLFNIKTRLCIDSTVM